MRVSCSATSLVHPQRFWSAWYARGSKNAKQIASNQPSFPTLFIVPKDGPEKLCRFEFSSEQTQKKISEGDVPPGDIALRRWHISGWCVVAKPVEKEKTWTVVAEPKTTVKGKTAAWKQTSETNEAEQKNYISWKKTGPMKMGWPGHVSNWSSGETALAKKNSAKNKTRAKHQQRVSQNETRPRSRRNPRI